MAPTISHIISPLTGGELDNLKLSGYLRGATKTGGI